MEKQIVGGKRITDLNKIATELVWVLMKFEDGSEFCFQTTLSPKILREYSILLEEGCLPRLDKKYYLNGIMTYKQFPHQGAELSLWDSLTYTDERSYLLHEFI